MIFAILTLLAALALATVAGWFSIIGIMTIYAGAAVHALIMGAVLEVGKLVTTSWLYRNWNHSSPILKAPLIIFTVILMATTSIGVFGFLSKAHLQQGAETVNNGPKIERINQQIDREKSVISDAEKVINQLDATVNSFLGKDRTDKSLSVRRSQEPQRKQLRNEILEAQKRIDQFTEEKLKLESEVRNLQLEVGPIRYIAELFYGTENTDKNIEAAVRAFTLLIVFSLDPLAVILLVAANHTLMRLRNEKENKETETADKGKDIPESNSKREDKSKEGDSEIVEKINIDDSGQAPADSEVRVDVEVNRDVSDDSAEIHTEISEEAIIEKSEPIEIVRSAAPAIIRQPVLSRINTTMPESDQRTPWASQESVLRELLGTDRYEEASKEKSADGRGQIHQAELYTGRKEVPPDNERTFENVIDQKIKTLSWLNTFKENNNG
jgi:cell division protein FtsL